MLTNTSEPGRVRGSDPLIACEFLTKPFPDCYCMNLCSANIPKMLALCVGNYGACPIYGRCISKGEAEKGR